MTKAELIEAIAKDTELTKKAAGEALEAAVGAIKKAIKKDKGLTIPDFGTFKLRQRKARVGRNPQTGKTIQIKASKTVGFRPSPSFKKSL